MLPRALDTQVASGLSRSSKLGTGGLVWPGMSPNISVDAQSAPSPTLHITCPLENCDRGPQFISYVWRAFFKILGVSVSLSLGYHPQTNKQTEQKDTGDREISPCLL